MYTFIGKVPENNIPFIWLTARDRSVWEIAWYYQSGHIKKEFIRARGNQLDIHVVNDEEYLLQHYEKYHLVFAKGSVQGYMKLKLPFEEGSFVASWYRLDLKEDSITAETWRDLFGTDTAPFSLPSNDEEYSDYVEEEYTLENHDLHDETDHPDDSDDDNVSYSKHHHVDHDLHEHQILDYSDPTKRKKNYTDDV